MVALTDLAFSNKKSTWNSNLWNSSSLWYKTYCLCFKHFHYLFTIVDLSSIPRDPDKRKKKVKPTPTQYANEEEETKLETNEKKKKKIR